MKLSEKMHKVGWSITQKKNGDFCVYAANGITYTYSKSTDTWSEPVENIETELDKQLKEIEENKRSPFISASRMTALYHSKNASQPVKWLCQKKILQGKSVLHLGTGLDNPAKSLLLESGCAEVADYDPNFYPDTRVLEKQYDAVIANYVLNIVPPEDREDIYTLIKDTLKINGTAYLTVQGIWPVEHNYKIIKKYTDGYLIKTGFNTTFRKGYTKEEFLKEIKQELGGTPRVITMFYSNTFVKWVKESD
ncbi:MAG: class I SAM-dependent methyltransferase [bacterium]